jgi:hypothetical protein
MTDEAELKTQSGLGLLPKDRTILGRWVTEFRPLGILTCIAIYTASR